MTKTDAISYGLQITDHRSRVSVIVPVYNVAPYLPGCLDSICGQTFRDFEIICVDDGSTDSSSSILANYASRDARIRIITQENQGLSQARNAGLAVARGEFVLFVDSDDTIHPQLLERTLSAADAENADLVSFAFVRGKGENKECDDGCAVTTEPLQFTLSKSSPRLFLSAWAHLYRRSFIGDLRFIPGIYFEDYPWTLSLLKRRPKTVILREVLYNYTVSNGASITNSSHKSLTRHHIESYRKGLSAVLEAYRTANPPDCDFVNHNIIPNYLKQAFNEIRRQPRVARQTLWPIFADLLHDLRSNGCLNRKDHRLMRYVSYRWLMLKYGGRL